MKKLHLAILMMLLTFSCHAPIGAYEEARSERTAENQDSLTFNGAKLFYRTMGKGKPIIVLHGGPGLSQDYFLPQMSKLAENNFVIFYDQRGCGKSTGEITPETITIEAFVNDLDAIRQAFQFEKISILGHSWGGFLAMQYAMSHPENIDKLILSNAMPASAEGLALFIQEYTRRTAPYQKELEEIRQTKGFAEGDPDLIERMYRIIFRSYCYNPEKANLLSSRMTPVAFVNGQKVYENINKNVFEKPFNLHYSLKQFHRPTLIIHGDFDPIPAITAQNVHESIPGSRYILIKNCGHFPYVEAPDEYFNSIMDFLCN